MEDYDELIQAKQDLFLREIIEKNYNKTLFIEFCLSKKEDGDDLNNWSFEELQEIVNEFIIKYYNNESNKTSLENENVDIPINTVRIHFPRNYYLSRRNIYLILYLGKTQKILNLKLLQFDWTLPKNEFDNIYKSNIYVAVYERNTILKDKYKGDFTINLSSLRAQCYSKQKYEIDLENKQKGEFVEVILNVRYPCEKLKENNKKSISTPNDEKTIKENNNNLNKEINDLKKELNNKDKIINDYKIQIDNLNEKIVKLTNSLNDKEKIIKEEKKIKNEKNKVIKDLENNNEKLRKELKDLTNEINEMKLKEKNFKEINDLIKGDLKNEKFIELIEKLEAKEKEIKEIKSRFPFELSKNEKLISIIMVSTDQKIHHSFICKNTDKFTKVEYLLYEIYPEYMETDNYFILNGNKINKYKSLEENKIKNSDIITLNKFDED